MAQNKQYRLGPAYLANAAANILNGAITSLAGPVGVTLVQPVIYLKSIHLFNTTAGPVTASLYVGATGGSTGGTEILKSQSIAANSPYDKAFFGSGMRLESTDFLTGLAGSASAITIEAEFEIGFQ